MKAHNQMFSLNSTLIYGISTTFFSTTVFKAEEDTNEIKMQSLPSSSLQSGRCDKSPTGITSLKSTNTKIYTKHDRRKIQSINGTPGFLSWFSGKESAWNAGELGDAVSIPGLGRSLREGNGNPLQYSCLGNPMNRGAWLATVHGVAKE